MAISLVEAYSPVEVKPKRPSPSVLIRKRSSQALAQLAQEDGVSQLPVEIIDRIVSFIDDRQTLRALMLTNRTFYQCIFPVFYASLGFSSYHSLVLLMESVHGPYPSRTLKELLSHWTTTLQLTHVGVSSTLKDSHLVALVAALPQLRHVLLHWCHKITDSGIRNLLTVRPDLHTLRLDRCSRLTDEALHAIAELAGPTLQVLSLSHVQSITDEGLLHIAQRCPNLRYLNVTCCDKITDASLVTVMQRCKQLRYLNARLAMMTEPSVIELTKHNLPLETLHLVHLQNEYTMDLLLQAIYKQSHLKHLHLSLDNHITVEHLSNLLNQHPNLQEIHLTRCGAVNSNVIAQLNQANWGCATKQKVLVTVDAEVNTSDLENDHLKYI